MRLARNAGQSPATRTETRVAPAANARIAVCGVTSSAGSWPIDPSIEINDRAAAHPSQMPSPSPQAASRPTSISICRV
jgi:hypothetical protein